jgi:HPt (histidine-containing phosphotransfer) domain-containing protein
VSELTLQEHLEELNDRIQSLLRLLDQSRAETATQKARGDEAVEVLKRLADSAQAYSVKRGDMSLTIAFGLAIESTYELLAREGVK